MQQPTAIRCPQCGAPPSPGRAILVCEYCGASMMVVPAPQGYGGGGPVVPFGAPGALPPAYFQGRRRNPGAAIALAAVGVLVMGGVSAAILMSTSSHTPPISQRGGGGHGGASPAPVSPTKMFEEKCNAGDAQACVVLGSMYQNGGGDVRIDQEKAKTYYAKACAMGDQSGCMLKDMGSTYNIPSKH